MAWDKLRVAWDTVFCIVFGAAMVLFVQWALGPSLQKASDCVQMSVFDFPEEAAMFHEWDIFVCDGDDTILFRRKF